MTRVFGEFGFGEMGFGETGFGKLRFGEMGFGEMGHNHSVLTNERTNDHTDKWTDG